MEVGPPWDLLELADGETRSLTITDYADGQMTIQPRDGRPARAIRVLRVAVPASEKPTVPRYWDITSALLIPELLAQVAGVDALPRRVEITRRGVGAAARFTLRDLGRTTVAL